MAKQHMKYTPQDECVCKKDIGYDGMQVVFGLRCYSVARARISYARSVGWRDQAGEERN